jgi:prepilin-type N-terminal cleavage/methylation domain-containing protein
MEQKRKTMKRNRRRAKAQEGMTLIEIMVVSLIMAMMSAGIAVAVMKHLEDARGNTAKTTVKTLMTASNLFLMQNPGECPSFETLLNEGMIERNTEQADPWKTPYFIVCNDNAELDIFSAGKDKREGTDDDIR